jgi:hypothetical protein
MMGMQWMAMGELACRHGRDGRLRPDGGLSCRRRSTRPLDGSPEIHRGQSFQAPEEGNPYGLPGVQTVGEE